MNQDNQVEWRKDVDRAVVELARICRTTPITEERRAFASMVVENKRRQDEIEYVRSLQETIERLKYENTRVAQDSYAEGIRRARERAYETLASMLELEPGTKIHNAILQSLEQLEEEVKK